MANELRHEILRGTTGDGTTSQDADAEFRNDSSVDLYIRGIDGNCLLNTAENDENAQVEISKAPTMQSGTNNSPFFAWALRMAIEGATTGAAVDDGAVVQHGSKRWGRGQLILEPNESLFINTSKTSGGNLVYTYLIEYEFK